MENTFFVAANSNGLWDASFTLSQKASSILCSVWIYFAFLIREDHVNTVYGE